MDYIPKIEQLISDGCLQEAVNLLDKMIDGMAESDVAADGGEVAHTLADLYFRRGKLWWRLGKRAAATSDYARASALDPASPAVKALEQARAVADFFNPDLYNP